MTLAFKTKIEGKPTYFIEKIWEAILRNGVECNAKDLSKKLQEAMGMIGNYTIGTYAAKIHTIREDKSNRWKAGNKIHFAINNRTPERFQFAPVAKVISVDTIKITHEQNKGTTKSSVFINNKFIGDAVFISCQFQYASATIQDLALNDGFDNVNEFFEWFSEDFKGKIIHWTDHKY